MHRAARQSVACAAHAEQPGIEVIRSRARNDPLQWEVRMRGVQQV